MIDVELSVKDFKKNQNQGLQRQKNAVSISLTGHLFEKTLDTIFVGILVFMGHRLCSGHVSLF